LERKKREIAAGELWMMKITTISDLSLVKSAMLIGKTVPRFRCLDIAAILFRLPAAECQGRPMPDIQRFSGFLTSDVPTDITIISLHSYTHYERRRSPFTMFNRKTFSTL